MRKVKTTRTTLGKAAAYVQSIMAANNVVYHDYDEADRARIHAIYDTLIEVYSGQMSFERFEHIFAKNVSKYREIEIFEWICNRFKTLCGDPATPLAEKNSVFNSILVESMRKWPVQIVNESGEIVQSIQPALERS
jgi:hypothetical protein